MERGEMRKSAEERREDVLRAAMTVFAATGLYGTSTERVAREAGVSQPYLFRLFPNKKAIFLEVVRRCFGRIQDTLAGASEGLDGFAAMDAMGKAYGAMVEEDRSTLLLLMQIFAACGDQEIQELVRARWDELWSMVAALSGAEPGDVGEFFATGMLINVFAVQGRMQGDDCWGIVKQMKYWSEGECGD